MERNIDIIRRQGGIQVLFSFGGVYEIAGYTSSPSYTANKSILRANIDLDIEPNFQSIGP